MKNPYIIAEIGINHDGRSANIKKTYLFRKESWGKCCKIPII